MSTSPKLSLVVPLFNEEKNIEELVRQISQSGLTAEGLTELILINNGSSDGTGKLIEKIAAQWPWIKAVSLPVNKNYGGGIYQGLKMAQGDFLGFIPGDLQVDPVDVLTVWKELKSAVTKQNDLRILAKGFRQTRKDGLSLKVVSWTYSRLVNGFLALGVRDTNGLPKIFHKSLLAELGPEMDITFFFDVQVLTYAKLSKWKILEIPVQFLARRAGVSSWSGKRMKVYKDTFKKLVQFRKELEKKRAA